MISPTGDEREAIQRIAARPEGQVVLGYLRKNADTINQRLVQERDPVALRIWQGQAQVLDGLLKEWKP
jgi:hypothetical protein